MQPRTHRGVIQLIHLHLIKDGALPGEARAALAQLEAYRGLSEYDAAADLTTAQAQA